MSEAIAAQVEQPEQPAAQVEPAKPFEIFSAAPLPAGIGETIQAPRRNPNLKPPFKPGAEAQAAGRKGALARDARREARRLQPDAIALARAQMLAKEIARTHKELDKVLEPRDRAQLLNSLDRMIERERILRGIPGPGNFRPSRSSRNQPAAAPTFEE